MDEKTRLKRFAVGLGVTLVATVIAGALFGTFGVSIALLAGLLATLVLGGGLGEAVKHFQPKCTRFGVENAPSIAAKAL